MLNRKINLLSLISYRFLPAKLGGHLAHVYFHNAITDLCHDVVVGSRSNEEQLESEGVQFELVKLFHKSPFAYIPFLYILPLYRLVKSKKIDIIFCSHPYLGITAWALSFFSNKPYVVYSHNIEADRFRTFGKWWWKILFYYEKMVMKYASRVFFVSNEDRLWAIKNYKLKTENCIVSPFGINLSGIPEKKTENKISIKANYSIANNEIIMYFVGAYNYFPNDEAVLNIVNEIYPRLENTELNYKILIVGKGLAQNIVDKIESTHEKILYLGFVEDIRLILDSADIMLNPMLTGGGIKTKAVEALGNNIKVISTENGSFGLDPNVCEGMLWTSDDIDWDTFVENIVNASTTQSQISSSFYDFYHWDKVVKRVVEEFEGLA